MAQKTTRTETSTAAAAQLAEVEQEIARLEAEHSSLNEAIGEALAKNRLGDKRASSDAGKLSMKRSGVETELRDLKLTKASLEKTVNAWQVAQDEEHIQTVFHDYDRLSAEARELEGDFAELIRKAATIGQRLRAVRSEWQTTRAEARRYGIVPEVDEPRRPSAFLPVGAIDDPDARIAIWKASNVPNRQTETQPRLKPANPRSSDQVMKIGHMVGGVYGEAVMDDWRGTA